MRDRPKTDGYTERKPWRGAVQRLFTLEKGYALLLASAIFTVAAVADYFTSSGLELTSFYIFAILLASWNCGWRWGLVFAGASLLTLVILGYYTGHIHSRPVYFDISIGNRLFVFLVVVLLTTQLRRLYDRIEHTARIDFLTGVPNRPAFFELLHNEIARYERDGYPFSVAYVDVDNFKSVNDRAGHKQGDLLLAAVGKTIRRTLRKTDSVARLGGDEFAIVFPHTGLETATQIVRRVCENLNRRMDKGTWPVTFSVGLGAFARTGLSPQDVIDHCDSLMYRVKRNGKNDLACELITNRGIKPELRASAAP